VTAKLVWQRADGSGEDFSLAAEVTTVGRDPEADVCLTEALVSRLHARIERRPNGYFVVDLGSTNLTKVNGEAVVERLLSEGDELRFGRAKCLFLAPGDNPG
jgi:pSer/pThr/pTyr-binding forkhead associated (FHA) protein